MKEKYRIPNINTKCWLYSVKNESIDYGLIKFDVEYLTHYDDNPRWPEFRIPFKGKEYLLDRSEYGFSENEFPIPFIRCNHILIDSYTGVCVLGGICACLNTRPISSDKDDFCKFYLFSSYGKIKNQHDPFDHRPSSNKIEILPDEFHLSYGLSFEGSFLNSLLTAAESKIFLEYQEFICASPKEEYQIYLKTHDWQEKRRKVLQRDCRKCVYCGNKAQEIHHLTYKNKYFERLDDLVSICKSCHRKIHQ